MKKLAHRESALPDYTLHSEMNEYVCYFFQNYPYSLYPCSMLLIFIKNL